MRLPPSLITPSAWSKEPPAEPLGHIALDVTRGRHKCGRRAKSLAPLKRRLAGALPEIVR